MDGVEYTTNYKLATSQIGCTLSHIKAIKAIEANNDDVALVMEDDVSFELVPYWPKDMIQTIIQTIPADVGIVQLYWGNHSAPWCRILDTYDIVEQNRDTCWGTVAYLVTRRGVHDILSYVQPTRSGPIRIESTNGFPRHGMADVYLYQLTKVYTSGLPMMVFNSSEFESTINPHGDLMSMEFYSNILSKYVANIKKGIHTPNIIGKRNVFMFWEGPSYKLIELLRESVYRHATKGNYTVHMVNYSNMYKYLPDMIPSKLKIWKFAHQADYLRVCLLKRYGGIWVDSDTIVMSDFHRMFDYLQSHEGFFILENNKDLCNGIFGSRPETQLMNKWYQNIQTKISRGARFSWTEIGSSFLNTRKIHLTNIMI